MMTLLFIFIFGLAIGSFLNVLIDRLPKDESIQGRSHCDFCKKTIAWYDLIPVVSFILLGGKCRNCKKALSWQYPLVELVTGILFIVTWLYLPNGVIPGLMVQNPSGFLIKIAYFGIVSMLIVIFFADSKYHIIPDQIQLVLFGFALIILPQHGLIINIFIDHVLACLLVAAPIYFLYWVTKGKGMGFGDVKLAFIIGLLMGIKSGFLVLYMAFILGALIGVTLMIFKKRGLKSKIAFGPFLVLSLFTFLLWQDRIFQFIKRLYGI